VKRIYLLLTAITVVLLLVGVQARQCLTAEKINPLSMEKANEQQEQALSPARKILVVYFSHSGNTRELANQIHTSVGGDIIEIQPEKPYPSNYFALVQRAKEERDADYKPALKTKIKNIASYDVIFIGSPIWGGTIPQPIVSFLSEYDLTGKTIVPFCTYGGSGQGRSVTDIAKLCPQTTVLEGFGVESKNVKNVQPEIANWLNKIKIIE
jgi:flavodoxin